MPKLVWNTKKAISPTSIESLATDLLKSRGLNQEQAEAFISPNYERDLGDPFLIQDMDKAVERIAKAIKKKEKVAIYGDYDIDGLSASALMNDALSQMGLKPVLYIPDRFEEGYGLNSKALKKLKDQNIDLAISVDCGTTAHKQAADAKKMNLDLIITDHHEPDGKSPKGAIACINPKLTQKSPLRDLAGVGVAFYLVRALQEKTKLIEPGHEKWLLDLVALGTICDVVPLTGPNRILAKYGLMVLNKSKRVGMKALADTSSIDLLKANETDLGFKIGPRLNAAGRLTHAKKALDILVADNYDQAKQLADELSELNYARRQATQEVYEQADKQAKQYKHDPILVLSSPEWSHGIVGIVASRISEKWHKPTILLQELDAEAKGSARSYGNFNIVEAIRSCENILNSFGGHSFAAGLKLDLELIKELRYRLNQYAITNMDAENNIKVINVSISLPSDMASLELYEVISSLAPFGNENKKPYCCSEFIVSEIRLVGSDASHLKLRLVDSSGSVHDAIGFGKAIDYEWMKVGSNIKLVYEISENIWNDLKKHQLEIIDIKPIEQ
jgi:single-stranded-DNA-specific exonuclease